MFTAYLIVTIITIVMNAAIAAADLVRTPMVLATSAEVGLSSKWIPVLGSLKLAAVVGLLLGFLDFSLIGSAAAVGLVLLYIGAVLAHLRAKVFYNIAFPGIFLTFSIATLVLTEIH